MELRRRDAALSGPIIFRTTVCAAISIFCRSRTFCWGLSGAPAAAQGGNGTGFSDLFTTSVASGVVQRYDRIRDVAGFAQDSWKAVPKLTINLGLRYEYIGLPVDLYGRNGAFDPRFYQAPAAGGSTSLGFTQEGNARHPVPGIAKVSNTLTDNVDHLNFAPRLGISAQVLPRVVLRAGYGIFYDRLSNQLGLLESLSVPNYVRVDVQELYRRPTDGADQRQWVALRIHFRTLPLPGVPEPVSATASDLFVERGECASADFDQRCRSADFGTPLLPAVVWRECADAVSAHSTMLEIGYAGAAGLGAARWETKEIKPGADCVAASACERPDDDGHDERGRAIAVPGFCEHRVAVPANEYGVELQLAARHTDGEGAAIADRWRRTR